MPCLPGIATATIFRTKAAATNNNFYFFRICSGLHQTIKQSTSTKRWRLEQIRGKFVTGCHCTGTKNYAGCYPCISPYCLQGIRKKRKTWNQMVLFPSQRLLFTNLMHTKAALVSINRLSHCSHLLVVWYELPILVQFVVSVIQFLLPQLN